jgi:hypothetical protein
LNSCKKKNTWNCVSSNNTVSFEIGSFACRAELEPDLRLASFGEPISSYSSRLDSREPTEIAPNFPSLVRSCPHIPTKKNRIHEAGWPNRQIFPPPTGVPQDSHEVHQKQSADCGPPDLVPDLSFLFSVLLGEAAAARRHHPAPHRPSPLHKSRAPFKRQQARGRIR